MKRVFLIIISILLCCVSMSCGAPVSETATDSADISATNNGGENTSVTDGETTTKTAAEGRFTNLFKPADTETGWYDASSSSNSDSAFRTSALIEVETGDVICFGAAVNTQGWHLVLYDKNSKAAGAGVIGSNVVLLEELDSGTSVMQYTVEQHVAAI